MTGNSGDEIKNQGTFFLSGIKESDKLATLEDGKSADSKPFNFQTKIKLTPGNLSSRIGVTVFPVPSITSKDNTCRHGTTTIIGIIVLVIFFVLYADLRQTKRELRDLKNLVEKLEQSAFLFDQMTKDDSQRFTQDLPNNNSSEDPLDLAEEYATESESNNTRRFKRDIPVNKTFHPLLAHYKGGLAEFTVPEAGIIAPWYKDKFAAGDYNLRNVILRDGKGSATVMQSGLYLVYAQQVYYSNSLKGNSYSINMISPQGHDTTLAICATPAGGEGESSCFTGTVRYIDKCTKIMLKQREFNRHVLSRQGQTFFGLVLLHPSTNET